MIFCRESKFIHYLEYLFQNPFIAIATWTRTHRYGAFDRLPRGMHAAERRMRMSAPVRRAPGDREARTSPTRSVSVKESASGRSTAPRRFNRAGVAHPERMHCRSPSLIIQMIKEMCHLDPPRASMRRPAITEHIFTKMMSRSSRIPVSRRLFPPIESPKTFVFSGYCK